MPKKILSEVSLKIKLCLSYRFNGKIKQRLAVNTPTMAAKRGFIGLVLSTYKNYIKPADVTTNFN